VRFLPNATAVILVAPIIIGVCQALEGGFRRPPDHHGDRQQRRRHADPGERPRDLSGRRAIGLSFVDYLRMVSLGGLLAALVVVPCCRACCRKSGACERPCPRDPRSPSSIPPSWRWRCLSLLIMVVLFIVGESLPIHIVPPQVAIIGASLALLVAYGVRVEPVGAVIRDVDWKTLVFLGAIFTLVQAFIKTDLLQGLSIQFHGWFGSEFTLVALVTLASIGTIGFVIANIPLVAAALVMIKGYLVAAQAVPEIALAPGFADWPSVTLPVFVAMMFGGTLGGNATLIGASANIVAVGICASNGRRVSFMQFLRIGLPITVAQLSVGALYVLGLTAILD
jgi:Na+/H+ antiporter NhaD/arsenite permease-like protein